MQDYALTYPQLMNQALEAELAPSALLRLRDTHDFAERMVDGMYRAQGAPFLTHLVRTGSIALAHGFELPAVLASITHAAFILHCFDHSRRQPYRAGHRNDLEQALGADVADLVSRYQALPWHQGPALKTHLRQLDGYDAGTRAVLAMRLANELEDFLDGALAYTAVPSDILVPPQRRRDCRSLALRLGLESLADDLESAYASHCAAQIPPELIRSRAVGYERHTRPWALSSSERLARRGLNRARRFFKR